jgi:hypothetical protein
MEDDNLLAEVKMRSGIRMERNFCSGKKRTDTTLFIAFNFESIPIGEIAYLPF